ncbi:hypothetical protein HETIRDRAFT_170983 [Heterobasidion irregulare TC 32-1]|uniref:Uncharacterized protein n=1 Tax=Heterobasidion irregulare (strain TC 32-1) TaxID=747525 RepID=W4KF71_HETIT|nr:uncharacterized protein HETIRDRAFT_170983 [Heterobasidion irregulare TC 32-1]ETW84488.1 hypothetical protein HETIRDRAFT_170983 [Heterobasidion irregulare TC 32-1]
MAHVPPRSQNLACSAASSFWLSYSLAGSSILLITSVRIGPRCPASSLCFNVGSLRHRRRALRGSFRVHTTVSIQTVFFPLSIYTWVWVRISSNLHLPHASALVCLFLRHTTCTFMILYMSSSE